MQTRIDGLIDADEVVIGRGVVVEDGVRISGKNGRAGKVVLGDFCFVGRGTQVLAPEFSLGAYSKLHMHGFCHGDKPLHIGRNCWIGGNCVLDSMGGLDIDDNVGIGAHSQLWTHIQFGDIVEGSRFFSQRYMHVAKDAWFVGHCIVSPVAIGEKSMAMVGAVVTKDMLPNHVYAGVPAQDVTAKLGPQFEERSTAQKATALASIVTAFERKHPQYAGQLLVVQAPEEYIPGKTCFDVSRREYTQTYSEAEIAFLRAHVPLVKFTPVGDPPFVVPQQTHNAY